MAGSVEFASALRLPERVHLRLAYSAVAISIRRPQALGRGWHFFKGELAIPVRIPLFEHCALPSQTAIRWVPGAGKFITTELTVRIGIEDIEHLLIHGRASGRTPLWGSLAGFLPWAALFGSFSDT